MILFMILSPIPLTSNCIATTSMEEGGTLISQLINQIYNYISVLTPLSTTNTIKIFNK